MSRYAKKFAELRAKKEGALIPFVVLGDPDFETSRAIVHALAKNADILELGFPFSDPIADGARIQAADERSLKSGMDSDKCFELIANVRASNPTTPIGLLLYYNLVYRYGIEKFLKKAKQSGVDGVLVADMPLEESAEFNSLCKKIGIEEIFIVAPTTPAKKIVRIAKKASGFIYVVGVMGVTGERKGIEDSTVRLVKKIRSKTKLPVCVGFGISSAKDVQKVIGAGAHGAIVGSAIEAVIEKNLGDKG
ncbi:MAG: tryptophan synthase subunit alpha, partial [archaeon]|nr:tryptophan synthase subunit alpha [archaeon]